MKKIAKEEYGKREVILDVLRGIFIILVMLDHFFYDAGVIYSFKFQTPAFKGLAEASNVYLISGYRETVRPIGLFVFFFISGLVFCFSKNKLKRAIKLSVIAILLFAVTKVFSLITKTGTTITFGVMYVFAVSGVIGWALDKIKTKSFVYLLTAIAVITIGLLYQYKVITFLSEELYFFFHNDIGYAKSADYYSLFPYLGYFLAGIFFGAIFYKEKKPRLVFPVGVEKAVSPISFIGKKSLYFYLFSQVAFIALFELAVILGA